MKKFKTLTTWIAEALSDSEKENPCSALACVYLKSGGGSREVYSIKLTGRTWEAKNLSEVFQGKAEAFAQDLPGISTFELQAFYGGNEPSAIHTFVVTDGEVQAEGRSRNVRETADGQGIIAQSMRHVERMHDTLVSVFQTVMVNTVQRERNWAEREQALQQEVTDSYTIIRDLMMKQSNDEQQKQLEVMRYARESYERREMIKHFPALANTVSGRNIFPKETADTVIVEALADNINPETIEKFVQMGVIKPQLAGMLTARLIEIKEERKREAEALKQMPPTSKDPKQDAVGESPTPSTNGQLKA